MRASDGAHDLDDVADDQRSKPARASRSGASSRSPGRCPRSGRTAPGTRARREPHPSSRRRCWPRPRSRACHLASVTPGRAADSLHNGVDALGSRASTSNAPSAPSSTAAARPWRPPRSTQARTVGAIARWKTVRSSTSGMRAGSGCSSVRAPPSSIGSDLPSCVLIARRVGEVQLELDRVTTGIDEPDLPVGLGRAAVRRARE
jgi:hypothetical protein